MILLTIARIFIHRYLVLQISQRFPLHMRARLDEIKHTWVTFWREERPGHVASAWSPLTTGEYGVRTCDR